MHLLIKSVLTKEKMEGQNTLRMSLKLQNLRRARMRRELHAAHAASKRGGNDWYSLTPEGPAAPLSSILLMIPTLIQGAAKRV
jgi:hypothetical protein